MALWRLIKNSIRFSFRAKKRWITFVIIFAFLSAFITFFAGTFNQYSTEYLLDQKGIYIKSQSGGVNVSQAQALANEIRTLQGIESVAVFRYFDLGDYIRVFGVNPELRWMFRDAKPSLIVSGHYALNPNEAVVSENSIIKADLGSLTSNVSATLHKGESMVFDNGANTFTLNIVGEIRDSVNVPNKLRLFITDDDFDALYSGYGEGVPVYCESIAILVEGKLYAPFSKEIKTNMDKFTKNPGEIYDRINSGSFGSWTSPDFTNPETTRKDRASRFLYFIFGMVGGILLTILYNFLIVWFRRREVAVLRAMGYEKGEIRINLIGESLTISFVGYITGILAIVIYFWTQGMTFTNQLLTWTTILISFSIVVILTIPGLLLSSLSFVRVSPVILFKAR
ncbi:MAG: ABC transporter permease [Candidatus Heimdallarchaeaceae archaeon]